MNYDELINYGLYLSNQVEIQHDLNSYIKECCNFINEASNVQFVNESLVDTMKNIVNKILATIMKVWNKFVQTAANLTKQDKEYLEKYKDIILKKKPLECMYTMYNYPKGIPLLIRTQVPTFNFNSMKDTLVDKDTFISKTPNFRPLVSGFKPPYDNFSDIVKTAFRGGGESKIASSALNMTDLYNYCYNYAQIQENIQADINEVNKAGNVAISEIQKLDSLMKTQQAKQQQDQNNQQQQSAQNNQPQQQQQQPAQNNQPQQQPAQNNQQQQQTQQPAQSATKPKKSIISKFSNFVKHESTLLEGDLPTRDLNVSSGAGSVDTPDSTNPAKQYKKMDAPNQKNQPNSVGVDNNSLNKNVNAEDAIKRIKVYLDVCSSFLGAKETCAENAYKSYMSIIKAHVSDSINNPNAGDQTVQQGTNYA